MEFSMEQLNSIETASVEALYGGDQGRLWDKKCMRPGYAALDELYPTFEIQQTVSGLGKTRQICWLGAGNARKESALQGYFDSEKIYLHGITSTEAAISAGYMTENLNKQCPPRHSSIELISGEFGNFILPGADLYGMLGGTAANTRHTSQMIDYFRWIKRARKSGLFLFDYAKSHESDWRRDSASACWITPDAVDELNWLYATTQYCLGVTHLEHIHIQHFVETLPENAGYRIHLIGQAETAGKSVNLIRYTRYEDDYMERLLRTLGFKIIQTWDGTVYTVMLLEI